MIDGIRVERKGYASILELPLKPSDDVLGRLDYYVEDVAGLDPVQASIAASDIASMDGWVFQAARRGGRNIVLTLGVNPDFGERTVQSLRERLYAYFMPKHAVRLTFTDSSFVNRWIEGYIESLEFPIFTKKPTATISILCPDPDFKNTIEDTLLGEVDALGTVYTIDYKGTTPTGVNLLVNGPVSAHLEFRIQSENIPIQRLNYKSPIPNNQSLYLTTSPGSRQIVINRTPTTTESQLYHVSVQSDWPMLYPGTNMVSLYSASNPASFTLSYTEKFGGL